MTLQLTRRAPACAILTEAGVTKTVTIHLKGGGSYERHYQDGRIVANPNKPAKAPRKPAATKPAVTPRQPKAKAEAGPTKRQAKAKAGTDALATAKATLAEVAAGEPTPEGAQKLLGHLSALSVAQLTALKTEYGVKGSGKTKGDLAAKIAGRLSQAHKAKEWKAGLEKVRGEGPEIPTAELAPEEEAPVDAIPVEDELTPKADAARFSHADAPALNDQVQKAMDAKYGYGMAKEGTFGHAATNASASAALHAIEGGETDVDAIADAVHEGWGHTAKTFDDPVYQTKPEKKASRAKLAAQKYSELPEEEKEKDRVIAREVLKSKTAAPVAGPAAAEPAAEPAVKATVPLTPRAGAKANDAKPTLTKRAEGEGATVTKRKPAAAKAKEPSQGRKARVDWEATGMTGRVAERALAAKAHLGELFGDAAPDDSALAGFVGAEDGTISPSKMSWSPSAEGVLNTGSAIGPDGKHHALELEIRHPKYNSRRSIYRDGKGDLVVKNDEFYVGKKHQGQGLGTKVFSDQVRNLIGHGGFSRIATDAVGSYGGDANGYYTWARLGYDGQIPKESAQLLPHEWKDAKTIHDVLAKPGGLKWWEKNGSEFKGSFDLSEGSRSLKTLNAYLEEKGMPKIAHSKKGAK